MNTTYTYAQLNEAIQSCTPCRLTLETNEDGGPAFALRDGCDDQMGDLFEDLYDIQAYVTNNQDVFDHLYRFNQ